MKEANLAAEFLIVGFIFLLDIVLLVLLIFHTNPAAFFEQLTKNKELVILAATLLSYLLGTILHRAIQVLNFKWTRKLAGLKDKSIDGYYDDFILIYQNGSDNLMQRVFFGERLIRIFKSATISIFLFGVEAFIYLEEYGWDRGAWFILLFSVVLSATSFLAHRLQSKNNMQFITAASKFLKNQNPGATPEVPTEKDAMLPPNVIF